MQKCHFDVEVSNFEINRIIFQTNLVFQIIIIKSSGLPFLATKTIAFCLRCCIYQELTVKEDGKITFWPMPVGSLSD